LLDLWNRPRKRRANSTTRKRNDEKSKSLLSKTELEEALTDAEGLERETIELRTALHDTKDNLAMESGSRWQEMKMNRLTIAWERTQAGKEELEKELIDRINDLDIRRNLRL
jgi:hypothetical protein